MVDHIEFIVKNIKKSIKYKEQASYSEIIKFIKRVKLNKQITLRFIKDKLKLEKENISLWCFN